MVPLMSSQLYGNNPTISGDADDDVIAPPFQRTASREVLAARATALQVMQWMTWGGNAYCQPDV